MLPPKISLAAMNTNTSRWLAKQITKYCIKTQNTHKVQTNSEVRGFSFKSALYSIQIIWDIV